jgi:5-methylcytosine-specific restriction enzyme subunit McrC
VKIPIANVYYLLCYAWGHSQHAGLVDVEEAGVSELPDLFAHVLAEGTAALLRQGLDRGYVPQNQEISGIRGKLDLQTTLKQNLLIRARTRCLFDEFEYDVQHNRILKATLRSLAQVDGLDADVQHRVAKLYGKLDAISDVRLTTKSFRSVQLHRNNRFYEFLMSVCRIVHDNVKVTDAHGRSRFRDFRRDKATMWRLFEDFVFNFYDRELDGFRVSRPHIDWNRARGQKSDLERLPVMRTDVYLESPDRRIVLDTKFYTKPLDDRFGERIKAGNLYQVFSYVMNREANLPGPLHEGILLYPAVERHFDFHYEIMGHRFRVCTVDLDRDWRSIRSRMISVVEE